MDMLERWGLPGTRRFVLRPESVQLIKVIIAVGSTGQVHEGRLDGKEVSAGMHAVRLSDSKMLQWFMHDTDVGD